jgi:hypothetical protein
MICVKVFVWMLGIVSGWLIALSPIAMAVRAPEDTEALIGLLVSPAVGMAVGGLLVRIAMQAPR